VARLKRPAFVVDYRRPPEDPYPAAVDDAAAVVTELADGRGPAAVALAGDSAGGGLSVATLVHLRDLGAPLPAAAWLLCPWVDLTMSRPSMVAHLASSGAPDFTELAWAAHAYGGDDLARPGVSPLFADLHGLPPLLVQAGGGDPLLDEDTELATRAAAAGVEVRLEVWERLPHVFQLIFAPFPEAVDARRRGVEFLDRHLSS